MQHISTLNSSQLIGRKDHLSGQGVCNNNDRRSTVRLQDGQEKKDTRYRPIGTRTGKGSAQ